MGFDAAKYNELCETIRKTIDNLAEKVWPYMPKALDFWLKVMCFGQQAPQPVVEFCNKVLRWAWDALRDLVDIALKWLEAAFVPITMSIRAQAWQGEVTNLGTIGSTITTANTVIATTWSGTAASNYMLQAEKHVEATEVMADLAAELASQCQTFADEAFGIFLDVLKSSLETSATSTASAATTPVDGPVGPGGAAISAALGALKLYDKYSTIKSFIAPYIQAYTGLSEKAAIVEQGWPRPGVETFADAGGWTHK